MDLGDFASLLRVVSPSMGEYDVVSWQQLPLFGVSIHIGVSICIGAPIYIEWMGEYDVVSWPQLFGVSKYIGVSIYIESMGEYDVVS